MSVRTEAFPRDLSEWIARFAGNERGESMLIPVLQEVQKRYGYLSREHMDAVSALMRIPATKVTGVATFYHFFHLAPRGRHTITVCMGTACFVRGADKVMDRLRELLGIGEGETTEDGRFSLESARCLGTCALAPVVVVGETVHGSVQPGGVEKLLRAYGWKKKRSRE